MTNWCGGCACGAIRHECEGKPATTSTAIAAIASEQPAVPIAAFAIKAAVSLKGKPCWYRVIGSSGKPIECGFCLTCGNPMTVRLDVAPDIIGFHAASLDVLDGVRLHQVPWMSAGGEQVHRGLVLIRSP